MASSGKCLRPAVILVLGVTLLAPASFGSAPLEGKDLDSVIAKANEKYADIEKAENEAGKSYMSARVPTYAVGEGDRATVWATVRKNLEKSAVFELHELTFSREGDSWSESGDEIVQTVDALRPVRLLGTTRPVAGFTFEHDMFSVAVGQGTVRPVYSGDRITGYEIKGEGKLKFTPPDDTQAFYLQRGLKYVDKSRKNDRALDEPFETVQFLFPAPEANRFVAPLGLDKAPARNEWTGTPGPEEKVSFGSAGIVVEPFEYKNDQYLADYFEERPGSFFVRAQTKGLGWIVYAVISDEAVPIILMREEKMFFFLGGDPSKTSRPNIWCAYHFPEDREGDPLAAERRVPPKFFDVERAVANVKIDEELGATLHMDWNARAVAARNLFRADFVLINNPQDRSRWTTVDAVLRDGKPQITVPLNAFEHRVYLDPPMADGDEVDWNVKYRSTAMLTKLDDNFTYVERGGWTPFLDLLGRGTPMELNVELPAKYDAMSFGEILEDKTENGVRKYKFFSSYPVNFPTIIYGQYSTDDDEFDGKPLKMHVAKSMRNVVQGGFAGMDDFGVSRKIPNIAVNRGKVNSARIEAKNSVQVFEKMFGTKYPYPKMDIVSAPLDGSSAQSPSGIIYVGNLFLISDAGVNAYAELVRSSGGKDIRSSDWKGVVAHEVAHQWWGAQVNNLNDAHYWFVESLAEISAAIYLAVAEGEKAYLEKVRSWKEGAIVADGDVAIQDIWRSRTLQGNFLNRYRKGPYVFHMFAQMFGADKLEEFLRNVATEFEGEGITTRDLQKVAEKTVNVDLEWFFDQWIRGVGIPHLWYKADWARNEKGNWVVRARIEQKIISDNEEIPGKVYKMYVPLYVRTQSGKQIRLRLPLTDQVTEKAWEVPEEPVEVTLLDNDETLAVLHRLP